MAQATHNLRIVIDKIKSFGNGMPQYMADVLERAMVEDVYPVWIEHISLQDHSLEDLRNLGHPYSTRLPADSFIHPDWEVHEQSGSLLENSRVESGNSDVGPTVQIINTSPHYVFLRYGTTTMRIRDPGGHVLDQALPAIRRRFAAEVRGAIVKIFVSE